MTIEGIDVSNYQGKIDWAQVAASGISFAIIHYTDGLTVDPWAPTNWTGSKTAGLVRGAYAYVYPQLHTADASARFFIATLQGQVAPFDFFVLDFEEGSGDQSAWALRWLSVVTAALGPKPLLYSRLNLLEEYNLAGNADAGQYGLAIASWGVTAPTLPPAWPFWAIWQYSAQGSVPGIAGAVDLDRFNGTIDQLRAYGIQPRPAPPAPTNDDLEQMHRLVDALPFVADDLIHYAVPFSPSVWQKS